MNTLQGKIAIITGASSGIGRAAAVLFAAEGAKVVLGARRRELLAEVASDIEGAGGVAAFLSGDVGDERYAKSLVDLALSEFGRLDVAFNNAGTLGAMGDTTTIAAADWDDAVRTNLTSAFFAAKYQAPPMLQQGSGSIVFTSTFVGYTAAFPGMASYAATKAGLVGLTQALAVELGGRGVRVNALLPGGTDTPMGATVASTREALDHVRSLHALKRIAAPHEIARSALYLVSEAASFVTGTALLVDGGVSIARGGP